MAEEGAAGFIIEGRRYEFPDFESFDLDEAEVFADIAGYGIEDLDADPDDPEAHRNIGRMLVRPKTVRALATIAYLRQHPELETDAVKKLVGKANYTGALLELFKELADPTTQESANNPDESSPRKFSDSEENSGTDSISTLDAPEDPQPPIGVSE